MMVWLLSAAIWWLPAATNTSSSSTLASIDASCRMAGTLPEERKLRRRIVADLSNAFFPKAGDGSGAWRSFATPSALDSYVKENGAPHTRAQTWSAADGTTIAIVQFESDGYDLMDEVEYCFRADGSLARADATLSRAFATKFVRSASYFGPDGRALIGRPGESIEPLEGIPTIPIYPSVVSLPFVAPPPRSSHDRAPLLPPSEHDRDQAQAVHYVSTHLHPLQQCYERALANHPTLAGTLVARWKVDVGGRVRDFAWQRNEVGDAKLTRCFESVFSAWHFDPPPSAPIEVSRPFVFRRSDEAANAKSVGVSRRAAP